MKKFCFFVSVFLVCFVFVGCTFEKKINQSISEYHTCLFSGEDDNFFATFSMGKREEPYVVDGKKEELVNFAVLTAYKINTNLQKHEAKYKLTTNTKTYSGVFEVNPFDNSFVVDLLCVDTDYSVLKLEIIADGTSFVIDLNNELSKNDASFEDVKKIANQTFKSVKSDIVQNNQIKAEVYYRLMKRKGQKALWYVSIVCTDATMFAIVVDPITKDVVAKNFK